MEGDKESENNGLQTVNETVDSFDSDKYEPSEFVLAGGLSLDADDA